MFRNPKVDEGLLEGNLNKREYGKDRELVYYKSREVSHPYSTSFILVSTTTNFVVTHDDITELPFEFNETNFLWLLFIKFLTPLPMNSL